MFKLFNFTFITPTPLSEIEWVQLCHINKPSFLLTSNIPPYISLNTHPPPFLVVAPPPPHTYLLSPSGGLDWNKPVPSLNGGLCVVRYIWIVDRVMQHIQL